MALWVPLGYAVARFAGHDRPLLVPIVLAVLLAGVHRFVPGAVELIAGGGGLLAGLYDVIEGEGQGAFLGDPAVVVVVGFCSVMWMSSFVRLLGSGNPREMARHLIVAAGALEVGLVVLGPFGLSGGGVDDGLGQPVVLVCSLLLTTLVALHSRAGFPLLGTGLAVAMGIVALTDVATTVDPVASLAGTATFVAAALALAGRDEVRPVDVMPARAAAEAV